MARINLTTRFAVAAAAALALTACTTHKTETPSLTGPSELGTSITIEVSPDVLAQDGASQSLITVTVRDSNGQPLRNIAMRANITVGGVITDFGTLSAKNIVSDAAGRASLVYTAPPAPAINVDSGTVVTIDITPTGTNFGNTVAGHVATIRLVPPGTVGAPASPFRPSFVPPSATVGDTAVFSATVVDASGNDVSSQIVSFSWSFGDGGTGSGRSTSHTFNSAGSFPVTLRIVDNLGRTAQFVQTLAVGAGANPTATFLFAPAAPSVGQQVSFNGSQSQATPGHSIVSYTWDFGDGSGGSGATTTHAYTAAGQYIVTLTTKDDVGRTSTPSAQTITVGNGGTNADFNFSPSSPLRGQNVTFDASVSSASNGRRIVTYAWNFDDGTTGSGQQTTHAFNATGTFNVRLTTTDDLGQTSTVVKAVTVGGAAPSASFTFTPSQPLKGQTVNFDASQSRAGTGRTITQYAWNFDDGGTAFGVTTQHAFNNTGTFQVRLTVTDDIGQTNQFTQAVVVGASNPTARFTFTPSAPTVNQSVSFDASQSTPAAGRTITAYSWNFDDGGTAVGVKPSHTFTTARTYQVRLTVTDDFGNTDTTSTNVTVTASVDNPPVARLTMNPASTVINSPIQADACASTATAGLTIVKYEFNWGDNRADSIVSGANCRVTHSYSTLGTYTVSVIVTDSAGKIGSTSASVTISSAASPTAVFTYSPASPVATGTPVTVDASNSQAAQNSTITSYQWNFGDSSTVFTSTTPTFTHTYNSPCNNCTITLTVHDNQAGGGQLSSTTRAITVGPTASFAFNPPSPISGGTTVSFDGAASTPANGAPITTYTWNWGDGTPNTSSSSPTATHTFLGPVAPATSVTRNVTLTVTDNRGAQSFTTKQIVVQ
jgi:PKD repeat protein